MRIAEFEHKIGKQQMDLDFFAKPCGSSTRGTSRLARRHLRGGAGKGELEWRRASRPTLLNPFANPIYAGVYAYGVRAVERRRQKPQAVVDLGRADEAVATLDEVRRHASDFHSPEGHLLFARALEAAGRLDEALRAYASVSPKFPGPEPRVREARLLERLGRREQARSIAEEVVRSLRRAPRHVQANEREWFALAKQLTR